MVINMVTRRTPKQTKTKRKFPTGRSAAKQGRQYLRTAASEKMKQKKISKKIVLPAMVRFDKKVFRTPMEEVRYYSKTIPDRILAQQIKLGEIYEKVTGEKETPVTIYPPIIQRRLDALEKMENLADERSWKAEQKVERYKQAMEAKKRKK